MSPITDEEHHFAVVTEDRDLHASVGRHQCRGPATPSNPNIGMKAMQIYNSDTVARNDDLLGLVENCGLNLIAMLEMPVDGS